MRTRLSARGTPGGLYGSFAGKTASSGTMAATAPGSLNLTLSLAL